MRRAAALFIGSYGRRDVPLSPPERSKAEEIAREIGRALVAHDIDAVVGGSFEMAGQLADGAVAACTARGLELRDRFRTFYAQGYPPPQGAEAGQLFRISDDESFWTYVLMEVDAVVAVSGRGNTRAVLKLARMLNKPVFPLGIIEGAASDVWGQLEAPELKFLGDRSRSPRDLAESIAKNIRQKNAPPWIVGQVFVVMNFGQDPSTFEAIAEGCSQIGLNAVRADDNDELRICRTASQRPFRRF